MAQAYQTKGISKTLESIHLEGLSIVAGENPGDPSPTVYRSTTIPSQATYGVCEQKYTAKVVFRAFGLAEDVSAIVEVKIGGQLVKQITYTSNGFKEDFIFGVKPSDVLEFTVNSNTTTSPGAGLNDIRVLVINSELKNCSC